MHTSESHVHFRSNKGCIGKIRESHKRIVVWTIIGVASFVSLIVTFGLTTPLSLAEATSSIIGIISIAALIIIASSSSKTMEINSLEIPERDLERQKYERRWNLFIGIMALRSTTRLSEHYVGLLNTVPVEFGADECPKGKTVIVAWNKYIEHLDIHPHSFRQFLINDGLLSIEKEECRKRLDEIPELRGVFVQKGRGAYGDLDKVFDPERNAVTEDDIYLVWKQKDVSLYMRFVDSMWGYFNDDAGTQSVSVHRYYCPYALQKHNAISLKEDDLRMVELLIREDRLKRQLHNLEVRIRHESERPFE